MEAEDLLAGSSITTVRSADGTAIAYDRNGDGPPLIYVGGALNDRFSGAPLATELAPRMTVYGYDRRGRGASGDTPPYAVEREIEDLHALIETAGGEAAVYGMSSGGILALRAAGHGLKITKVAVYEPPIRPDNDANRLAARRYATKLAELLAADRRGDALELFMTEVGIPAELIGQMRHAPMWPGLEALAPSLAYDSAVMGDSRGGAAPDEWAGAVGMPALVLRGGESPAWMGDAATELARRLPQGQFRLIPDQTHDVAAAALAPVLADFFLG
jgi:pimeloyl-ACP methyl ester carboxylesterase